MKKINAAIIGFGNIGQAVLESINTSEDFTLAGIVEPNGKSRDGLPFVTGIRELSNVDVAIIAAPSRAVPGLTEDLLSLGISCVDAFDIHGDILSYKKKAAELAVSNSAVSIIAAGWDPGTDSIIRALLLAMAPRGLTFTDFGPGMSMGHSVCARGKEGVRDALSMTMPLGDGIHRRMVYVELEDGAEIGAVAEQIKSDDYFSHDETHVIAVPDVNALRDMGHGVKITRKGMSGSAHNQLFSYEMRINNPALTAQVLICAARAATKTAPGAYTMIEIPLIDFLPGDKDELIKALV